MRAGLTDSRLRGLAKSAIAIYVFELFVMVATLNQPQSEVGGRKLILCGDIEAACAALTKRTADVDVALV